MCDYRALTVAGKHRQSAESDLHHDDPEREERWTDRRAPGPGPQGEQGRGQHQDRDQGGQIAMRLLHEGVKLVDRSDDAVAQGPVRASHSRLGDPDVAAEDDQAVDPQPR